MAYQIGTLNTIQDLNSIFGAFLIANGWTKTTNSVNVANCTVSGTSLSQAFGVITSSNSFANIPIGAKITATGMGGVNCYLTKRTANNSIEVIYEGLYAGASGVTAVCTWDTYTKGNKRYNFVGCNYLTFSNTIAGFVLQDIYHLSSGHHGLLDYSGSVINNIPQGSFPCTYHLFHNTNPDTVSLVIVLPTGEIRHLHVGDLSKIHASSYTGGEFMFANGIATPYSVTTGASISDTLITLGGANGGFPNSICFAPSAGNLVGLLRAEIDGQVWNTNLVKLSQTSITQWFRSLNNWNQQAVLITPEVHFTALSSLFMSLGVFKHIRLLRIDNYNIGDEITLGTDVWKTFPVKFKLASSRNFSTTSTGTLGFAVRKT